MKLQYLAQVQRLLDEYDFQDKYKVLLKLEAKITNLEENGEVSREQLLDTLGSPAEYVSNLVRTYDLARLSELKKTNKATTNTDDLLTATNTNLEAINSQIVVDNLNLENIKSQNSERQDKMDAINNSQQSSNSNDLQKQVKSSKKRSPFKLLFTLFFVFAFFGLFISVLVATRIVIAIDIQTAISLILGVLFLLITIGLIIKLSKQIVEKIFNKDTKTITIFITLFLVVVFAILSKIMLSSTLETVNMYVTNNLSTVQTQLLRYHVDYSNIDWSNLDS